MESQLHRCSQFYSVRRANKSGDFRAFRLLGGHAHKRSRDALGTQITSPRGRMGGSPTDSSASSGLANSAAGHCSSCGSADSYGARGARQRSGGVEKYSSIASRQAPEHGSAASSPGPDSRISAAIFSAQLMQTPARSNPQPVQLQLDL